MLPYPLDSQAQNLLEEIIDPNCLHCHCSWLAANHLSYGNLHTRDQTAVSSPNNLLKHLSLPLSTPTKLHCQHSGLPNMDSQLIPFMLRRSSDCISSGAFPPPRSARRSLQRRISTPIQLVLCPDSPVKKSSGSLKLRRLSDKPIVPVKHPRRQDSLPKVYPLFQPPSLLAPYTSKDWEVAMVEVRTLYFKRRYKLCAERCVDILENPRGPIHHLRSLFFSFYAATCLEMQALRMHVKSSSRLPLLNHAKAYYEIAASYVTYAEAATNMSLSPLADHHNRNWSFSSNRSTYSNPRSSIDSTYSPTDSIYSVTSQTTSPASSVYDSDGLDRDYQQARDENGPLKPRPLTLPSRKKVSFQPSLPTVVSNGHMSAIDTDRQEYLFPAPPTVSDSVQKKRATAPSPLPLALVLPPSSSPPPDKPLPPLPPKSPSRNRAPPFLQFPSETRRRSQIEDTQATIRYQSLLLSFRPQITYHLATVSKSIHDATINSKANTSRNVSGDSTSSEESSSPIWTPSPTHVHQSEPSPTSYFPNNRNRSYERDWHHHNSNDQIPSSSNTDKEVNPFYESGDGDGDGGGQRKNFLGFVMSLEEKRARIEKGRARMWVRREKFCGERYERLCERALMELQH